ncbi:hypothetical protein E2C01_021628 [Portunus trituberculatus]|uniref:Uncharacterized protein n=1 Tax=Portunus trituberculatus TaxID=210409 RepID=A0A5B7E334_PORTR|nr:hypothetical protein [Portunus trituberculatus]
MRSRIKFVPLQHDDFTPFLMNDQAFSTALKSSELPDRVAFIVPVARWWPLHCPGIQSNKPKGMTDLATLLLDLV